MQDVQRLKLSTVEATRLPELEISRKEGSIFSFHGIDTGTKTRSIFCTGEIYAGIYQERTVKKRLIFSYGYPQHVSDLLRSIRQTLPARLN